MSGGGADPARARELVASVPVWYHVMELAPGVETPGEWDMRPYLSGFGFPASLAGMRALDVGASNGFFAFHFERLGAARVVATELARCDQLDHPAWYARRMREELGPEELARLDHAELAQGFEVARELLGSRVERVVATLPELPERLDGRFDLVFCGNVLQHLRDPLGALDILADLVTPGGTCIVAMPVDLTHDASYALFVGRLQPLTFWVPSPPALLRWCEHAGLADPRLHGTFPVAPRSAPDVGGVLAVVHARA